MTPTFCPRCRAIGIIAVVAGPTCTHHQFPSGPAWFPEWWDAEVSLGEGVNFHLRRMAFLESRTSPATIVAALAFEPPPAVQEFDFA